MTELIWQGKYDKEDRKTAPVRIALPSCFCMNSLRRRGAYTYILIITWDIMLNVCWMMYLGTKTIEMKSFGRKCGFQSHRA